jgi:hypothetical protein
MEARLRTDPRFIGPVDLSLRTDPQLIGPVDLKVFDDLPSSMRKEAKNVFKLGFCCSFFCQHKTLSVASYASGIFRALGWVDNNP